MSDLSHAIGGRVYQARMLNEWTQERLAKECRMSRAVISKIENGDHNPQTLTLHRIAVGLNVPVGVLLPPSEQGR